jgi:hypothetical protein
VQTLGRLQPHTSASNSRTFIRGETLALSSTSLAEPSKYPLAITGVDHKSVECQHRKSGHAGQEKKPTNAVGKHQDETAMEFDPESEPERSRGFLQSRCVLTFSASKQRCEPAKIRSTREHQCDKHGSTRVVVVGLGNVGATLGFALLLSGLAAEIVLIDKNHAKAEGEAMDLNHAVPFAHPTRIWAGTYEDCASATVVVIAAGAAQKPGETRLDLLQRNANIFAEVVPRIVEHNRDCILLIATNPVDVLTQISLRLSGLPAQHVIGSGTILDTARFR